MNDRVVHRDGGTEVRRISVRIGAVLAGGVAVAVACGSAVAQQVTNLPAQDRVIEPSLDRVYSVGSLDGADWETFGEVRGTAFDSAGDLYILDTQSSRVVVVGPDGKLVREVGSPGDGPGELGGPVGFAVLRDGTIVVTDMGHQAYVVYGPDGKFRKQLSFRRDGGMVRIGDIEPDPRGGAILTGGGGMSISMSMGPGQRPELPAARPIQRIPLDGQEAAPLTLVDAWQPPRDAHPQEIKGGGMRFSMAMAGPRTFEPGLYLGPLPDGGLAYVDSSDYTVKVTDADGRIQRVVKRPFQPRPVTDRMEQAEKERRLEDLEAGEGPRMVVRMGSPGGGVRTVDPAAIKEMMKNQIDQMEFYPEVPVLMGLSTGWNGKIWVQRRGAEPTEKGAVDVLRPDGMYVGTLAEDGIGIPDSFGPGGLVAYVTKDEMDVPKVEVRRLPPILR